MEVTVTGFIHEAKTNETTSTGKTFKRIVIRVPARVNQFGESVGEENFYEVTIFGDDKISAAFQDCNLELAEKGLAKCSATCYVNGSRRSFDGRIFYNIQLTLKLLKWLN
jgi:hypothetical protein